jgi:DNA-binding NarL/FixJ family response regulator
MVVLADDHTMFREVVAEMLSTDDGIEILGEANDGVEAVALVREKKPDVMVLDVEMPVMGRKRR